MQMECSAIERLDCFELFVDSQGRVTNTPWPGKSLQLPKSLFLALSDEGETRGLQLLMPLGTDMVDIPDSILVQAPLETQKAVPDPIPRQVAYAGNLA